jgi:hypothetical protein
LKFQKHLSSIHPTMGTEEDNTLPFFDTLVKKKLDRTMEHRVYRKLMQRSIPACQLSPSSITKMCCFSTFI